MPAPTSVWYYEDPSAQGTGNASEAASDGIGDTATSTVNADGSTTATSTPSGTSGKLTSVGSLTVSYSVSASASTVVAAGTVGTVACSAGVGQSTTIHAQPFHLILDPTTPYSVLGSDVHVNYDYWSTDGNIADIDSSAINLQESVVYSGGGTTSGGVFTADDPPFRAFYNDPTNVSVPIGGSGGMGLIGDVVSAPGFQTPYAADSYTGTQKIFFSDADTSQTEVDLTTGIAHVRSSSQVSGVWTYTCSVTGIPDQNFAMP